MEREPVCAAEIRRIFGPGGWEPAAFEAPSTALRAAATASMNAIGFIRPKLRALPRAVIGGDHPCSTSGVPTNPLFRVGELAGSMGGARLERATSTV